MSVQEPEVPTEPAEPEPTPVEPDPGTEPAPDEDE